MGFRCCARRSLDGVRTRLSSNGNQEYSSGKLQLADQVQTDRTVRGQYTGPERTGQDRTGLIPRLEEIPEN